MHLTLKKKSKLTEEVRADPMLPWVVQAGMRLALGPSGMDAACPQGSGMAGDRTAWGDWGDRKRTLSSGWGQVREGFPKEGT